MAIRTNSRLGDIDGTLLRWAKDVDTSLVDQQQQLDKLTHKSSTLQDSVNSVTSDTTPPSEVAIGSITQAGYIIDGVLYSEVTCTYTAPNPIGNFAGVFFVIQGYRGSYELVKENEHTYVGAGGGSATFKTTLQRTGETVTIYLVAKNHSEAARSDWVNAPHIAGVVLNGNASAPATPTGATVTAVPIGLAVSWNENTEANIQSYNVWRNTSNSFGTATNIGSAAATGTGKVQFADNNVTVGTTYWYFITAVNTAFTVSSNSAGVSGTPTTVNIDAQVGDGAVYGRTLQTALTSGSVDIAKAGVVGKAIEMVRNPGFESGDRDWTKDATFTIVNDPTNAYAGSWVGKYTDPGSNGALRNSILIAVQPGDVLVATAMVKRTAGTGSGCVRISWVASNGSTELSTTNGNQVTASTYTTSRVVGTAPASAFFGRVEGEGFSGTSTVCYFDQFNVSLFPKTLDEITDGPTYGKPLLSRLSSGKPLIDFSEGIHLNKVIDNLGDSTYAKTLATRVNAGRPLIDFAESFHVNKIIDNLGEGLIYGKVPLGLHGADGRVPATSGRNLVYNGDFSIHTPPTGIQSAYASSVRVDDPNNSGAQQQTPNGWTRNFESALNGEGVFYRADLSGFGFVVPGFGIVMQDRQGSTGGDFVTISDAFPVAAGVTYKYSANMFPGVGTGLPAHAIWFFRIFFYKSNAASFARGGNLSVNVPIGTGEGSGVAAGIYDIVNSSTSTTVAVHSANIVTPSDAGYARIAFYHWSDGSNPGSVWNLAFGDVRCVAVSNLDDEVADGSTFGRPLIARLSSGKPWIDFSEGIHSNKHLGNIPDDAGSDRRASTANQLTGSSRAFTNINSDNTYRTIPYHGSAFRLVTTSNASGNTTVTTNTFTTVASFVLQIPSGFTSYKGVLTVSHSGLTPYTIQGRIKIGGLTSNVISSTNATPASGTVTITGLTGGTQITVEVQGTMTPGDVGTETVSFAQVQYTDQDITNLQ